MVETVDSNARDRLLDERGSLQGAKRDSLEEARKSAGALLNMRMVFVSETLRELAYEQLTFSIRRALHKKIAEWYEYTYTDDKESKHAFAIAKHWEAGQVKRKAINYYFSAGLHQETVGNSSKVLAAVMKARELLLEVADEDMSETERLLLSRIDVLRFKVIRMASASYVNDHSFLRTAMRCICDGEDCFGGICEQTYQCASLALRHQSLLSVYLTSGAKPPRSSGDAGEGMSKEKLEALGELYHACRVIALTILDKTIKITMANPSLTLMNLSFLRMRLAFELGDQVLIGVAFSSRKFAQREFVRIAR